MERVVKTRRGVGICRASTDSIQVDRFNSATGCAVKTIQHPGLATAPNGWVVATIANNGTLIYKDVDFTPSAGNQLATIAANISSTAANGSIEVRIGSSSGALIATIPVPSTGNLNTYQTTEYVTLTAVPEAGVKDLALVFKAPTANAFQVNWIKFGEAPATSIKFNDVFIDKSGFSCKRINKNQFKVFSLNNAANAKVKLYTISGREIYNAVMLNQFTVNGITLSLDATKLCSGVYLLGIKNSGGTYGIRFKY